MNKEYLTSSVEETKRIAFDLASEALKRRYICLTGTLGAGKTIFTSGLVDALCPECTSLVHSPTFAIVNEYIGKENSIFHFDLYRIKNAEDLYSTGFYDYEERNGIIVAEWSDLFYSAFPKNAIHVKLIPEDENTRRIIVSYEDQVCMF